MLDQRGVRLEGGEDNNPLLGGAALPVSKTNTAQSLTRQRSCAKMGVSIELGTRTKNKKKEGL